MKCGETVSSCVQGRDCDFIPDWATAVGSLSSFSWLVDKSPRIWAPSDEPSPAPQTDLTGTVFFRLILRAGDANDRRLRRWTLGQGDAELRLVSRGALSFQRPSHSGRAEREQKDDAVTCDPGQILALFL